MQHAAEEITVLVVDDDDIDAMAVERALKKEGLPKAYVRARDGIEALDFLRGENGQCRVSKPLLVLLDINMPRMNGHEFLDEISSDPDLADTVVFVLTTSNDQADRQAVYSKRAAGYIVKSDLGKSYDELAIMLRNYWRIVSLPH
ncbi:MAG: two-component system response regulator [Kordiimonadales bacterium]|nr:MAG: two-component system response regulator [Kordiimonadales bacterium]